MNTTQWVGSLLSMVPIVYLVCTDWKLGLCLFVYDVGISIYVYGKDRR